MSNQYSQFRYYDSKPPESLTLLLSPVLDILARHFAGAQGRKAVFEFGCGNGVAANAIAARGYEVGGIDLSESGIRKANEQFPHLDLRLGSVYDSQVGQRGRYPAVMSLEVIEHLYLPRLLLKNLHEMLEPGGLAILSTPYHGYWKNLALALTGKMDEHFTATWDGGHIKFWSMRTLGAVLQEAGFVDIGFRRVGRIPCLAKSMIATARKPFAA